MKVPSFKTEKIRDDIFELVELAPSRSMYEIVMNSIDHAMDDLEDVREEIPSTKTTRKRLKAYDDHYSKFGEREAYYYQAFLGADDRAIVDAPLFNADYSDFEFEGPEWPDIETPWRMANELATAAVVAGMGQDFLDELDRRFKNTITEFWNEANRLITRQKEEAEAAAESEEAKVSGDAGRRYGFWPALALGAVALVGAFGAAAGYSASKSGVPGDYVEMTWWGKHKAAAKNLGLGFAVGVAAAALIILRVRR